MANKKQTTRRASKAEIRYAETLYCEKKWTPEAIANDIDRDIKTIYAWRDKYGWTDTRDLFDTGPTELKKILLKEAVRISKGEARFNDDGEEIKGIDADSLSKVMKAYDYMSKKASPEVVRDVLIELDNFSVTIDPEFASKSTRIHKLFLQHKISLEA